MVYSDKIINECRLCLSNKLTDIIDFGNLALGNNLHKSVKEAKKAKTYPLKLNKCLECNHFQLSFSVNPIDLYAKNYTYTSSVAPSFVEHLKESAIDIMNYFGHDSKVKKILDVGSNDGTSLIPFKEKNNFVLGVDPAKIPSKIANKNNIETINSFFSYDLSNEILAKYSNFDIIISYNVLAHVENLQDVLKGIHCLLKDNGLLVFEIGYFKSLISNTIYDTIYHEHLDYHSKKPLSLFLKKMGFSIQNITENNIQGGSLRFYCRKDNKPKIADHLNVEFEAENSFLSNKRINDWQNNIYSNIEVLKTIIFDTKRKGGYVYGFGAPTKATLVLNLLKELSFEISCIADDNSLKVDKYISINAIKIVSKLPNNISQDDVILCFAWNFFDQIYDKLKNEKQIGKFVNVNNGESRIL